MNGSFNREELRALFTALRNGTLSSEDHARLEFILSQSAEARRLWFLDCDLETGLADWAAARGGRETLPVAASVIRLPAWKWFAPLAAAAAVMIAAGAWWFHRPGTQPFPIEERTGNGVAVLLHTVGAEWEGESHEAGAVLPPGMLRLKAGAVLVEFYSGARVVVEGPAEFQLVSAGGGFLQSGRINAHVPPQARGFTVDSSNVKVVDHGTDFGFERKAGAPPEVHVFAGKVEVAAQGAAARALNGGEAVRFDSGALSNIPAARAAFLTEEELVRRDSVDANKRFSAWRAARGVLSADPATVIHYDFEEAAPAGRKLFNHAGQAPQDTHGSIVGGSWTEGRWPGKRALEFRSEGDRIRLIAAQPQNAVTFLAWVRVESLSNGLNTLLAADTDQTGALRWQVTQAGQLRLEIARDLGNPKADWEAVNSKPFVTPARLGQWLLLATTFDGSTVRHYGNGRLIGTGASFTPPALLIGAADAGNWSGKTLRNLTAKMDEFAILSRTMSAEEITSFYQRGKP